MKVVETMEHSFLYMMVPILIAFTTCVFLTAGSYLSRAAKAVHYPPMQYSLDFCNMAGLFYLIGFIIVETTGQYNYPFDLILWMSGAGLSIVAAFILLNAAVLSGKGALAMAIS